jgi:hypothetical protein
MRREKVNAYRNLSVLFLVVLVLLSFSRRVACDQDDDDDDDDGDGEGSNSYNNPAAQQIFSELVSSRISNFTSIFKDDITKNFGFCITDVLVYIFRFRPNFSSLFLYAFVCFFFFFFFLLTRIYKSIHMTKQLNPQCLNLYIARTQDNPEDSNLGLS